MLNWEIPYKRNLAFIGHEDILTSLHNAFRRGRLQALTGPNGIGKTQLALEYAYRYGAQYQKVFWINASSQLTNREAVRNVTVKLHREMAQRKWLLVLDQLEDITVIDTILPKDRSGHVLLTTHVRIPDHVGDIIPVPPLSPEDAALFLLRRIGILGPGETLGQTAMMAQYDAIDIAALLQGNPVALDQAGGYMKSVPMSLPAYLHKIYREMEGMDMLQSLISDQLQVGKQVVYFEDTLSLRISIGCIKEVKHYEWGDITEDDGSIVLADVVLLEADNHAHMTHHFYLTYLNQKAVVPASKTFYVWPAETLPPQTFQEPKRTGHEKQIRLKLNVNIAIASSVDFEDGENM